MTASDEEKRIDIHWVASSLDDLRAFPEEARMDAGHALDEVQRGGTPVHFDYLHGVGNGVMEIKIRTKTDTYRVVYVAKFPEAIYVLDAFKKKSPTGKKLPQNVEDRLRSRYQHVENQRPALVERPE